jgi:hypothetical protein
MIIGKFHEGSGLGNQLHRYVMTRVLALDKGYDFGIINPHLFKGASFMNLDMGKKVTDKTWWSFEEKKVVENGVDIRGYDPEINFVEDDTIIDGEFQDERYFGHRMKEINEWLHVKPLEMSDGVCIIGFRGGEYQYFPDLFLSREYWDKAIALMRKTYPHIEFEVVTDDPRTASVFFPNLPITHEISDDWRKVRYAKHLIIANSSFFILPALLNEDVKEVIAPFAWARHNIGVWALPQNYYKKFTYI